MLFYAFELLLKLNYLQNILPVCDLEPFTNTVICVAGILRIESEVSAFEGFISPSCIVSVLFNISMTLCTLIRILPWTVY